MTVLSSSPLVLLVWSAIAFGQHQFPDCQNGPLKNNTVCNPSASAIERATALVKSMTVAEKINNTGDHAAGVERLGLPPYEWWQEALHGVASSPGVNYSTTGDFNSSTSFPMPISLGATFNDDLVFNVASIISTEARAFNNVDRAGLDFWTPNINPFKDPRWGRGPEVPSEDTHHLQSYIAALLQGLEGPKSSKYKKIVATCKHYAGYDLDSWAGNDRMQFDAQISTQDLVEYYLPGFQTCARDSDVGAFMCSYNAVNGVPSCADDYLLQTVLREHWNWTDHWVTSDCDAAANVYLPHQYASTPELASALSLSAGTDLDCGNFYQDHLPAAFEQGLFNETTLDQALVRLYSSLVTLGYFDDPNNQPYRQLGWKDVNTPNAQQLAYEAAVQAMTLLKNDGTLPLSMNKSMQYAIIGSWANGTTQMQGNYYGIAPFLKSPLQALVDRVGNTSVTYSPGITTNPPVDAMYLTLKPKIIDADVIFYVAGPDKSSESEGNDRYSISWTANDLRLMTEYSKLGKKLVVLQMGGGQVDDTPLLANAGVNAILWGGYPGQDGGNALMDVVFGKEAPAGRLPITQYPANYVTQVPMTNMSLRPGENNPGRTYRWYSGEPILEFGFGLHYTNFSAGVMSSMTYPDKDVLNISSLTAACSTMPYLDLCPFDSFSTEIKNEGSITSDYVSVGFLSGTFGPQPHPKKSLVAYDRLLSVESNGQKSVTWNLTLGSLSRVDPSGNRVVYPGNYTLALDVSPLSTYNFTLVGEPATLDSWPQPPNRLSKNNTYFYGSYGTEQYVLGSETPLL